MQVKCLFILSFLTACTYPQVVPEPTSPLTIPESRTAAPKEDPVTDEVQELRNRAAKVEESLTQSVRLEGSERVAAIVSKLSDCGVSHKDMMHCSSLEVQMQAPGDKFAAKAGIIISLMHHIQVTYSPSEILLRKQVIAGAEIMADELRKTSETVAAREVKLNAEQALISDARTQCTSDYKACKEKCTTGNMHFCYVQAELLRTALRLTEAQALAAKTCAHDFSLGCALAEWVQTDINASTAKVDAAWSDLQDVGDDIVRKQYQTEAVSKMAHVPHLMIKIRQMRTLTAAMTDEQFCPKKKAFLNEFRVVEYTKRASNHCSDNAPETNGLSGANMKLRDECTTLYASVCR